MILARFWYGALALALVVSTATLLLTQSAWNRRTDSHLTDQLQRDRLEIELWLKLDARARAETVAPLAQDAELRRYLRADAATRAASLVSERRALELRLGKNQRGHAQELHAELTFLIDIRRAIVAQAGGSPARVGSKLEDEEWLRRAANGYLSDGILVYQSLLYLAIAHPVSDQGQYLGVLVQAKRLDDGFAQTLSQRLGGPTVMLLHDSKIIAQHQPPGVDLLSNRVVSALLRRWNDEELTDGKPVEILTADGHAKALLSRLQLDTSARRIGYASLRSRPILESPLALLQQASADDAAKVRPLLIWLLLSVAALVAIGLLAVYLEHDRPLRRLSKELDAVLAKQSTHLEAASLPRHTRVIGKKIEQLLERYADEQSNLGAASSPSIESVLDTVPPPQDAEEKVATVYSSELTEIDPSESDFQDEIQLLSEPPRNTRQAPFAVANSAPQRISKPQQSPSLHDEHATTSLPLGLATLVEHNQPQSTLPLNDEDFSMEDEDSAATMVAKRDDSLVAALRSAHQSRQASEQQFRRVFEEFTQMRKRCGETTQELTYTRFSQMLRKNIEQIRQTHGTSQVVFKVYVKDGRAALKATPQL